MANRHAGREHPSEVLVRSLPWLPIVLVAMIGVAQAAPPKQDPEPSKLVFKATRVAPSVYLLSASGGNVLALVGVDGVVLVDSDYAEAHANLLGAIRGLAGGQPVRYLIETHYHLDHSSGGGLFAAEGATLIAHETVAARLEAGATIQVGPYTQVIKPVPPSDLPTLAFDSRLLLTVNGEVIKAVHFPAAHTDGDVVVFFRNANVVHMGDVFVRYGFPFIDVPSGGRVDATIAACEAVIAATDENSRIIPGHGAVAKRADLIEFVNMLKGTRAAVHQAVDEGISLEQIKRRKVLAPWTRYSNPYVSADFFIETIYRSMMSADQKTGPRCGEPR